MHETTTIERIGDAILADLLGRKGVGNELEQIQDSDAETWQDIRTAVAAAALRELRDNPPVQLMGSMTRDFALCISAILAEHEAAHD